MLSSPVRKVDGPRPKAVVVGVQLPDTPEASFMSSLGELERLADTLGLEVVGRVTQRRTALSRAAVLGEGKLRELSRYTGGSGVVPSYSAPGKRGQARDDDPAEATEGDDVDDQDLDLDSGEAPAPSEHAEVVLVDHDLSPSQMRNLERATGGEVMDRSMVILAIFQRHARTREARMQVEIAQLAYMAPRLRESNAGQDRQRGGIGGKGAGESALELDRRRIRDRIAELRSELENVKREADTRRSRRTSAETSSVALVGYTNAGKSSLMRALTGDEVYVADQLFATLDTTVRALVPETRPRILVSDTVGFIKRLPHDLVASFRSTLEEAKSAALLLHLVDASDPVFREQYQTTRDVLSEIGADQSDHLLVLNKADRLSEEQKSALRAEFPNAVLMSARSPEDVAVLHQRIVAFFERNMLDRTYAVPYALQKQVSLLHERCRVLEQRYEADANYLRVRAPLAVLAQLEREGLRVAQDATASAETVSGTSG